MSAQPVVSVGGGLSDVMAARYQQGNQLLDSRLSFRKSIWTGSAYLLGTIGVLFILGSIAKFMSKETPRTRIEGVVQSATNVAYTATISRKDQAPLQITKYRSSYQVRYKPAGDSTYVVTLEETDNLQPVVNGDTIQLQYDNSSPSKAYRCCRWTQKATGSILAAIGALLTLGGAGLYFTRNNLYLVAGQQELKYV